MNVLILSENHLSSDLGGTERITCNLIKELEKRGYIFYNFIVSGETIEDLNKLNKYIVEKNIDFILSPFLYSDKIINLMEIIDEGIKVISILHFSPDYAIKGLKSLSHINHENILKEKFKNVFYKLNFLIKKEKLKKKYITILKHSHSLVLLSEGFKYELKEIVGDLEIEKIKVIPNFLPNEFNNDSYKSEFEKEKNILYVGRIQYGIKRLDRLIKIWEDIHEEYSDWNLKIVGDGPFLSILKNYVEKKDIKNIYFLGSCNPESEYKKAEIICLVSDTEGMPMVILEGSNYGCIPISFASSTGIRDMIIDGENGYVIESLNMEQYKNKLRELMSNPDKREIIRKKSMQINNKFNKSKIIDEWIDLFERIKMENQ